MDVFYAIYFITTIRFFLHHGILVFPIPKKTLPKTKSTKNLLIQYPVRNEPEHLIQRFLLSLKSVPFKDRGRIHVQILDDYDSELVLSYETNNIISELAPISIRVLKRSKRWGNKAGNMNYGLSKTCLKTYPYVAIFDADHIVDGKGMIEALDVLEGNSDVICVQSRWVLGNLTNTPLSLLQEQTIRTHIEREQTFRSVYNIYPIFNGAGGIWKIKPVVDLFGGFIEENPCEDTDISGLVNSRGFKIKVISEWTTVIENVVGWSNFRKQQQRWAIGNGIQLQRHIRDPHGWGWKKLYWLSWNLGHLFSLFKYPINLFIIYRITINPKFHLIELLAVIPHIFSWIASCLTWDNKLYCRGIFLYPIHFFIEQFVLPWQIYGFFKGFIKWNKHHDFVVTKK